jgi:hypothetical protein
MDAPENESRGFRLARGLSVVVFLVGVGLLAGFGPFLLETLGEVAAGQTDGLAVGLLVILPLLFAAGFFAGIAVLLRVCSPRLPLGYVLLPLVPGVLCGLLGVIMFVMGLIMEK